MSQRDGSIQTTSTPGPAGPPLSVRDRVRSLRLPDQITGGRAGHNWLPWALCSILLVSTIVFAIQAIRGPSIEPPKPTPTTRVAGSEDVALESKGYIIPARKIQVSPLVGGRIMELYIEEGMFKKEGDTLAVLEKVEYQADYDRAQAALIAAQNRVKELTEFRPQEIEQLEAELKEAEVQRDQLEQDFKRSQNLRYTKALADREFELAESAYLAMKHRVGRLKTALDLLKKGPRDARIEAAQAEVRQAQAELDRAKWRLDNCIVRAPVSGIILTKGAEKGDLVNPVAFKISTSLCEMADLSDLEVDLTIQERDISNIFKGQRCRIISEAFPDRKPYEGFVSRLMPTADRAKGAIPVRVKLKVPPEEQGVYLKPDMGVIVSFLKKDAQPRKGD